MSSVFPKICSRRLSIKKFQRAQLEKAKFELFSNRNETLLYDEYQKHYIYDDLDLYQHNYGTTRVKLLTMGRTLTYWPLWKCSSRRIESLLKKLEFEVGYVQKKKVRTTVSLLDKSYLKDEGNAADLDDDNFDDDDAPPSLSSKFVFPFSFIRDPIRRFVSGYVEIELRNALQDKNLSPFPWFESLNSKEVGSVERIQGFIELLIMSNLSGKLSTEQKYSEIAHVAPMVGTMYAALKSDGQQMWLYDVDDFDNEWMRLSSETGLPELANLIQSNKNGDSKSNLNHSLYQTTLNFLSSGGENTCGASCSSPASSSSSSSSSLLYIRALCRIYLLDYACTRQSLPAECIDMANDVASKKINKHSSSSSSSRSVAKMKK